MKHATQIQTRKTNFYIDSAFILFCLALEFGRTITTFSIDGIFLSFVVAFTAIASFWLPSADEPSFGDWITSRMMIIAGGIVAGAVFNQLSTLVLPETFRFVPTTLLLMTAMIWTFFQFYGFLRLSDNFKK